jgi:Trk-type K+ transport system membrane component
VRKENSADLPLAATALKRKFGAMSSEPEVSMTTPNEQPQNFPPLERRVPGRLLRLLIAILAMGGIYWEIGWEPLPGSRSWHHYGVYALLLAFVASELWFLAKAPDRRRYLRGNRLILLGAGLIGLIVLLEPLLASKGLDPAQVRFGALFFIGVVQGAILVGGMVRALQSTPQKWMVHIHPGVLAVLSFGFVIVLGAILLVTPNASAVGQSIGWIDAFFTSTSAVCVTGLIVLDTQHDFSFTGQSIILLLIQVGGLGVMTLAYLLALLTGGDISLKERVLLRDLVTENNLSQVRAAIARIVGITLIFELIGYLWLSWCWRSAIPATEGNLHWHALFHSISAYCNAGFSTFSENLAHPFIAPVGLALLGIGILVTAGGIGVPVWNDLFIYFRDRLRRLFGHRRSGRKPTLRLHSRIVLCTHFALLVAGFTLFVGARLQTEGSVSDALGIALFDSMTTRTAGFNVRDLATYAPGTLTAMLILMFVGGSPGGTAGGVKTTTVAVMALNLRRVLRQEPSIRLNKRTLPDNAASEAFAIVTLGLIWIMLSALLVQTLHPKFAFVDVLFECTSAFATVGLSRNLTPQLGTAAKLVLISNMFVGRIGLLLLFRAAFRRPRPSRVKYPQEPILLG